MKLLKFLLLIVLVFILAVGCGTGKKSSDYAGMSSTDIEANEKIADLRENVEDEPKNLDFRYQLSQAYQDQGRDIEALRTLEDGVSLMPSNADLKYTYAELAVKIGENQKGFTAYKEILQGCRCQQICFV